jgi:hypothetical protein
MQQMATLLAQHHQGRVFSKEQSETEDEDS